jgi:hypothetical protein
MGGFKKNHLVWDNTKLTDHKCLVFVSWEAFNDPVLPLLLRIANLLLDDLKYDFVINCKNNAY